MWKSQMGIILKRGLLVSFSTLLVAFLALVGVVYVMLCGPSESAQKLLTHSLKETSAVDFLPDLFLPEERVAEIMRHQDVDFAMPEAGTPPVTISAVKKSPVPENGRIDGTSEEKEIEFYGITGPAYRGLMMVVKDPTRLFVGTLPAYGGIGMTMEEMVERYDAVGGINGGGFEDANGHGTGGLPRGIIISDGKILWGSTETRAYICGFDDKGTLHVGYLSGQEALDRNVRWACSFGPALIIDGQATDRALSTFGVNPRTAIGQRADGSVLMLIIEGRQITSLGARQADLVDIMFEYGAVNATNLDGGASTQLIYNGDTFHINTLLKGRRLPTALLVRK